MSQLILIAGGTGQGKTRFANQILRNATVRNGEGRAFYKPSNQSVKQYIFDLNNEYILPTDDRIYPHFRHVRADQKQFVQICKNLMGYSIVFEDASGFLRGKQGAELIRLIVQRRHQKNNWIILFHSVNRIPPELMEYCNTLVIFKTNDNIKDVDKKFKNQGINQMVHELSSKKNHSYLIKKML